MTAEDPIGKIVKILEMRVQVFQSRMASELRSRDLLRAQQLAIISQEDELVSCLSQRSVEQPMLFRHGEIRLEKLLEDQRRLQPVLARAAIQRTHVQDHLKDALRQKLAMEFALKRREREKSPPASRSSGDHVLFEMQKRR